MGVYRIRNWQSRFENNRTRDMKRMAWVPMPNGHDGDGYTEIMEHEDGALIYGVWAVLVQIASRCSPRGLLIRDGAGAAIPHDHRSLMRLSRMKVRDFEIAIPILLQVGWLEELAEIPQEGAEIPQEGAEIPQEGAEIPQEGVPLPNGTEPNGTEGKERNRKEELASAGTPTARSASVCSPSLNSVSDSLSANDGKIEAFAQVLLLSLRPAATSPKQRASDRTWLRTAATHILSGHVGDPKEAWTECKAEAIRMGKDKSIRNPMATFNRWITQKVQAGGHVWAQNGSGH